MREKKKTQTQTDRSDRQTGKQIYDEEGTETEGTKI